MPVVAPGSKVLVTGANGYIAIWVVRKLLEAGYSVRGTVRSEEKGKHLKEYFRSYGDKLEVIVVADITEEGAFDEAVKGIDAIEHTASPFRTNVDEPDEYIGPAVRGTTGILQSAMKNGQNVKRIVVTSSCGTVMAPPKDPTVFTELDWNVTSVKEVEQLGIKAANISKYRASKVLAEKAVWEFYEKNKERISWDIVVLNPPFVFGPPIHEVKDASSLNTSLKDWYDTVVSDTPKSRDRLLLSNSWIDVRDLGEVHTLALTNEAAGGERIIVSAGVYSWQEWLDVANLLSPSPFPRKLPIGEPGLRGSYLIAYNVAKAGRIFGWNYKTKEETTRDSLSDFAQRGW